MSFSDSTFTSMLLRAADQGDITYDESLTYRPFRLRGMPVDDEFNGRINGAINDGLLDYADADQTPVFVTEAGKLRLLKESVR